MPFEYGGQTWPDTTVVTEHFKVTFRAGGKDPDFPKTRYHVCYQSYREGQGMYSCAYVRDIKEVSPGVLSGTISTLREGGTRTTAYIKTLHFRNPPNLVSLGRASQEEVEYWSEVRVSVNSNQIEMPQAEPYVVPEPGFLLLLAIGVAGLWLAGWRRETRSKR